MTSSWIIVIYCLHQNTPSTFNFRNKNAIFSELCLLFCWFYRAGLFCFIPIFFLTRCSILSSKIINGKSQNIPRYHKNVIPFDPDILPVLNFVSFIGNILKRQVAWQKLLYGVDQLSVAEPFAYMFITKPSFKWFAPTITDSDNGLSPGRRQAVIWTNAEILLIGLLGTKFNEILIEIDTFSLKKMHLKVSSGKWRPFCLGLNVLRENTLG